MAAWYANKFMQVFSEFIKQKHKYRRLIRENLDGVSRWKFSNMPQFEIEQNYLYLKNETNEKII